MPIFLLWLAAVVALWCFAVAFYREKAPEDRLNETFDAAGTVLLVAVPPTAVFLVSAFVLLQAAPTVQFNAGSGWAMGLWSFWVHWWVKIFAFSGFLTACYLVGLIGTLVTKTRASIRYVVGLAFVAAALGTFLLSHMFPTA